MDDTRQSLVDHLDDLRQAIIGILAVLLFTISVGYFLAPGALDWVKRFLATPTLVFFGPFDGFYLRIRLAVILGLIIGFPAIITGVVWFIGPGMTMKEKKVALFGGAAALGLFVSGAAYALSVMLPYVLAFLMDFSTPEMQPFFAGEEYLTFLMSFIIYISLVFELPLLVFLLLYLDILSPRMIGLHRKWCFACLLSLALFFSPGGDLMTQVLMALPLYVLFEAAIFMAKAIRLYTNKI